MIKLNNLIKKQYKTTCVEAVLNGEDMIPEYDTQYDDVVFIPNDPEEVDPSEELPF